MNRSVPLLFLNVFVIATCGLIYELLAGTLASYVLGDSVTQFSIIIGLYLFAMGVGSWLSRFIESHLAERFIDIELAVAILGGFSAPLLFFAFANVSYFSVILYGVVFGIGTLVGLEIPLLMRILKDELDFKELVARVLALDYVGALVASILFPIFFVPTLGLVRTSLVFGILNAIVGLWGTWLLVPLIKPGRLLFLRIKAAIVITLLVIGAIKADSLTVLAEESLFQETIIHAQSSQYQRIIVTRGRTGFSLFLNGNLQFNSFDEYRYHEALVHPAMIAFEGDPKRVLVLGGGDGLAVREVLKYPTVEHVTLVDLDPAITDLAKDLPVLAELNKNALTDKRVEVINSDAYVWLDRAESADFDVAILDFPDPNNFALGKLYSTRFYKLLQAKLRPDSTVAIQSTSPLYARNSYWCIVTTIEASGFGVRPYQTTVPSFGIWGYVLAKNGGVEIPDSIPENVPLAFLDDESMKGMFEFPVDTSRPDIEIEINRLDNQALVRYYEAEWRRFE
ncbi:MAG: polyamine aminopropyltransferase [Acidobacteria bacterium]|nr:MAG: polyamine aminopropyltransferase [Acidobacteriota bacterium]REJ98330.1 MAG: polyamine aminopropyltransferase [Acidobacteriota bacterium]REK17074.1 MAG: polyamine aminopropyltransferase [Acidobacteriota bacterium]REK42984.1 MAG: polyamine aminopropyltransferase [Acidobacteriota bacterium]